MDKILYEYYYRVSDGRISVLQLIVERETAKMFYGNVEHDTYRFAVKKENINKISYYVSRKAGTVYKVVVEADKHKQTAMQIIRNKLQDLIDNLEL